MRRLMIGLSLAALICAASPAAHAGEIIGTGTGLIDVQFGSGGPTVSTQFSGAAVIGSAGDSWNYFQSASGSASGLQDSAGQATGVSISFSAGGAYGIVPSASGFYGSAYAALMQSFLYTGSSPITVTLSGLTAGAGFTLYLYSQSDFNSGTSFGGDYTANGASASYSANGYADSFTDGVNYVVISGVVDGDGVITLTDPIAGGKSQTVLNGLQLSVAAAVPEPMSVALLGAGLLGLAAVRRRSALRAG